MTSVQTISDEKTARTYVETLCDRVSMDRLGRYCALLLEENQHQNLISKPSEVHLWQRHIADSAQLLEYVSRETFDRAGSGPWLDLGTGPGLPGLVIAILRPDFPLVLVESRARRVEFLNTCVEQLGLENCTVIGDRLERITPFAARVISARAFAPLDRLMGLSAPFSTASTRYLLPKGRSAAHELATAKPPIRNMFHVKHSLTDPEAGIIVSK